MHRESDVLDKVRARIEKLRPNLRPEQMTDYDYAMVEVVKDAVAIIDEYKAKKEDVLDEIRAELIQSIQNGTLKIENGNEELFRIIDKYKEKESATVARFHDFYPEDQETWPPEDTELLVKNHVGDNFLAYLEFDDGEDGGWGFYNEDGDFIADLDGIDAWMQIPQHERDKNYIPKRRTEDLTIDAPGLEEEEEKG